MTSTEPSISKAKTIFQRHNGMLRTRDAIRFGIHPRTLYKLRDIGELERVGPGLYRLVTAPALTSPDLVPVAVRVPVQWSVSFLPSLSRPDDSGSARDRSRITQPRAGSKN